VIGENEHFITLAPYAPAFPIEMWLLPKVHGSSYEIIRGLRRRYDPIGQCMH